MNTHSTQPVYDRPRLSSRIVRSAMRISFILLLIFLNPLGMRQAADQLSRDIYNRAAASFYRATGQDKIAVITIDDDTRDRLTLGFPPEFSFYQSITESLFAAGAQSLFFDIAFLDQRTDPENLPTFATALSLIPSVIGLPGEALQPTSTCEGGIRIIPEIASAADYKAHTLFYDNSSHLHLTSANPCPKQPAIKAAAVKLYEYWCEGQGTCMDIPENSPDLVVSWGNTWPENYKDLHPGLAKTAQSCPQTRNSIQQLLHSSMADLFYMDATHPETLPAGCTYHPVIRAEWLLSPETYGINLDALQNLLHDRIVLIGADFAAIQDHGYSPVFGKVPGVMVHAMALDNLISLGESYKQPWPSLLNGRISLSDVVEIMFLVVFEGVGFLICSWLITKCTACSMVKRLALLIVATALTASMALVFGMATAVFWAEVAGFEPINWTGIVAACWVLAYPMYSELLHCTKSSKSLIPSTLKITTQSLWLSKLKRGKAQ